MVTYKYKIQNAVDFSAWMRPFNNVVRFAYNRFQENPGISINEIVRWVQQDMKHIEGLDFSLLRNAVNKASYLKDKPKVIFGSKKLFSNIKFFKFKKGYTSR